MSTNDLNYSGRYLALRLPPVCVAVAAADPTEMVDRLEDVAHANPFVELRLDYLPKPALVFPKLKQMLHSHLDLRVIATCRRAAVGGRFKGSVASQIEVLQKAIATGCHLVDLEVESAAAIKQAGIEKLRRHAAVIVSFHDFKGTKKLQETFARMSAFSADVYKVITTAHTLSDNVEMLNLVKERSQNYTVVGFCMGEQGQLSRILAVRSGSSFIYAAAEHGEESAPGQLTYRELRDTYRMDRVDAATRVYGVAGDPVSHSLSPLMLNSAFRRENINAVYVALPTKELADLVRTVKAVPIHGLSVTMPYKEQILEHLDNTDAVTSRVGACNTVVRSQDGRLFGFNTDYVGVLRPIEQRMNVPGARVLVIGAGGAARAAVFGLKEKGADVSIVSRTPAAAQKLARQAKAKYVQRAALKKMQFDVIINASSSGMTGKRDESPLAQDEINARYVMELIYSPPETKLIKLARARGCSIIYGAEVFVQQGARQFEIWTGKPAPVDEMTRVVMQVLGPMPQDPPKPPKPSAEPAPAPKPPAAKAAAAVVPVKPLAKPTAAAPVKASAKAQASKAAKRTAAKSARPARKASR